MIFFFIFQKKKKQRNKLFTPLKFDLCIKIGDYNFKILKL